MRQLDERVAGDLPPPARGERLAVHVSRIAATRNAAISSLVARRLGASRPPRRAPTSTAPSGPSTSRRCCRSGDGGRCPDRLRVRARAHGRQEAVGRRRGMRSGRPRSDSRARRSPGLRRAISTSVRSGTTHEAGLSRRRASSSRQAARDASTARSRALSRPWPFTRCHAVSGSGTRRASGP